MLKKNPKFLGNFFGVALLGEEPANRISKVLAKRGGIFTVT
jgi:hypothetical protein